MRHSRKVAVALAALGLAGMSGVGCSRQSSSVAGADVPAAQCPVQGTATSAAGKALNTLKNRATAPTDAQINPAVTLSAMLADGDDTARFDQGQGAVISGYVIKVEQGGRHETANCRNMTTLYTDTHITVAASPNAPLTRTLIAEVTPTWRVLMRRQGHDWRTERLEGTLVGHRVKLRGWLMFDTSHVREATNTAPNNPVDWRKTVWEIHPITSMTVVQ
jgi:hypothetical protein